MIKIMVKSFAGLAILFFLASAQAEAATLLIGDKISVEADEVIDDDYYVSVGPLGSTVMSGTVKGDMYSLAGSVTANGSILGDFGTVSGLAYMNASVTDDVRIVAGEAVIDDVVGGDVFVIAGVLKVLSTAKIGGDLIFYGGEGEINGEVGGSIFGTANTLRIDAPVAGDINVEVPHELTLGSKANVAGNISYRSSREMVRAQEATIAGEVNQQSVTRTVGDRNDQIKVFLIPLLVSLFATLTLYLLFKKEIIIVVKTILASPLPTGLLGLSAIVAGPFVSLLLITTLLGMLLGIFGIGVILILLALGFSFAIVLTGALISRLLFNRVTISLWSILLGAAVFHSLFYIPFLGILTAFALVAMSVGGVLLALYRVAR